MGNGLGVQSAEIRKKWSGERGDGKGTRGICKGGMTRGEFGEGGKCNSRHHKTQDWICKRSEFGESEYVCGGRGAGRDSQWH